MENYKKKKVGKYKICNKENRSIMLQPERYHHQYCSSISVAFFQSAQVNLLSIRKFGSHFNSAVPCEPLPHLPSILPEVQSPGVVKVHPAVHSVWP